MPDNHISNFLQNCEMECLAEVYLKYCKCILYFLPRLIDDITICGRSDDVCVRHVTTQIAAQTNSSYECDCLPGCFELTYDGQVSMAPMLDNTTILRNQNFSAPNVSVLHIFYKKKTLRSERKEELVGFTDFLCRYTVRTSKSAICFEVFLLFFFTIIAANTGGLLALFMGFSVFSIVEVVYFSSLRPFVNYLKVSRQRKLNNRMKKIKKRKLKRILTPRIFRSYTQNVGMPEYRT